MAACRPPQAQEEPLPASRGDPRGAGWRSATPSRCVACCAAVGCVSRCVCCVCCILRALRMLHVASRMLRMLYVALHMLYVGASHLLAPPAAIMQHPESSHASSPCDSCGTFECCKHAPGVHRPARSTPPAASSEPEHQSPRDGVGTPPTRASARECSAQGSPSALPEIPSHQSPAVSAPPLGRPRKGFRAEQKRLLRPRGVVKDQLQSAAALTRAELYGGA
jgi:hypothetical protein